MDVRYNFLNTLDHYPCELIRTLWTLQSLDLQQSEPNVPEERRKWLAMQMSTQAELLEQLTEERIKALQSHREDLVQLQGIRKRCKVVRKRQRNQAVKEGQQAHHQVEFEAERSYTTSKGSKCQKHRGGTRRKILFL